MYQNLMYGVKRRILSEVEDAFEDHPQFSGKIRVVNKFPYEERISIGVVLRNTAGSYIRMSADNYMADIYSHIRLAKTLNAKSTSIEWVKENEDNMTRWYVDNVTVDPTQRLYYTTYQMVSGPGNTEFVDNFGQIQVKINGVEVFPEEVNGEEKSVLLRVVPNAGDTLTIGYYRRILAAPGIYQAIFNSETDFSIYPTYEITDEVLVERTTGLETTVTLQQHPIGLNSENIFLNFLNVPLGQNAILLNRNTDYTVETTSGVVTFLSPVSAGYKMTADYYTEVKPEQGPYTFKPYQEVHNAVPGVVICMGRRAVTDDKQLVIVSKFQEPQARIYGGHWEMSLSLAVISKDPIQMEEMTDQIVNYLWAVRKNQLEFEGITLNRVEPTGESEESYVESTGDLYYETSIDINVMTEWQKFVPYIYKIRAFDLHLTAFEPYMFQVIKAPTIGYEKVS
jgi:hypothetical protein